MTKTASLILTLMFIVFPEQIKKGAIMGINSGIFILLPSIFPYIAVSNIFLKTGAADFISDITYKFTKRIFRFNKSISGAYLISLFCGYPTGAKMASMLENYGKREGLRLFSLGNVPGFGFCVSFLGTLLGNAKTGVKIYLCFVFSSVILNFIFSFFLKDNEKQISENISYSGFSEAITESVKDASFAIISIIGYAVFFSSISEIFYVFIKNPVFCAVISAFLEITAGITRLNEAAGTNIPIIIFFTGFSGLSVIFQSLSFKKSKTPIFFVLFARLLFAIVAVLLFYATKNVQL